MTRPQAPPQGAGLIPGAVPSKPVLKAFPALFQNDSLFNCSLNRSVRAPSAAGRGGKGEDGSESGQRLEAPGAGPAQLCGSRCSPDVLLPPSDSRAWARGGFVQGLAGLRVCCPLESAQAGHTPGMLLSPSRCTRQGKRPGLLHILPFSPVGLRVGAAELGGLRVIPTCAWGCLRKAPHPTTPTCSQLLPQVPAEPPGMSRTPAKPLSPAPARPLLVNPTLPMKTRQTKGSQKVKG